MEVFDNLVVLDNAAKLERHDHQTTLQPAVDAIGEVHQAVHAEDVQRLSLNFDGRLGNLTAALKPAINQSLEGLGAEFARIGFLVADVKEDALQLRDVATLIRRQVGYAECPDDLGPLGKHLRRMRSRVDFPELRGPTRKNALGCFSRGEQPARATPYICRTRRQRRLVGVAVEQTCDELAKQTVGRWIGRSVRVEAADAGAAEPLARRERLQHRPPVSDLDDAIRRGNEDTRRDCEKVFVVRRSHNARSSWTMDATLPAERFKTLLEE